MISLNKRLTCAFGMAVLMTTLAACMPAKSSRISRGGAQTGTGTTTGTTSIQVDVSAAMGAIKGTTVNLQAAVSGAAKNSAPSVTFTSVKNSITKTIGKGTLDSVNSDPSNGSYYYRVPWTPTEIGTFAITAKIDNTSVSSSDSVVVNDVPPQPPTNVRISATKTTGFPKEAINLTASFTTTMTGTVTGAFGYSTQPDGTATVSLGSATCSSTSCSFATKVPDIQPASIYFNVKLTQVSSLNNTSYVSEIASTSEFRVADAKDAPQIVLALPSSDCCVVGQNVGVRATVLNVPGYNLSAAQVRFWKTSAPLNKFSLTLAPGSTALSGVYYAQLDSSAVAEYEFQVMSTGNSTLPAPPSLKFSTHFQKPGEIDLKFGDSGIGYIKDLVDQGIDYGFTAIATDPTDSKHPFYAAGWMKAQKRISASAYNASNGTRYSGTTFLIAKFNSDGTLDQTFNSGGTKGYLEINSSGADVSKPDLAISTLKGCSETVLDFNKAEDIKKAAADIWSKPKSIIVLSNKQVIMSGITRRGPDDVAEFYNGTSVKVNPYRLAQCEAIVAVDGATGQLSSNFGNGILVVSGSDELFGRRNYLGNDSERIVLTTDLKIGYKRDYFGGAGLVSDSTGSTLYTNIGMSCRKGAADLFSATTNVFDFLDKSRGNCTTGIVKFGLGQKTPTYATASTRNDAVPQQDWIHYFNSNPDRFYSIAGPFANKSKIYMGGISNGWNTETNAFIETYANANSGGDMQSVLRFDCAYRDGECKNKNVFVDVNTGKRALQITALSALNEQPTQMVTKSVNLLLAAGVGYTAASTEKPDPTLTAKYNQSYVMAVFHENNDETKALRLFPEFGIRGLRFYDLSGGEKWIQQLKGMAVDVETGQAFSSAFIAGTVTNASGKKRMSIAEIMKDGNLNLDFGSFGVSVLNNGANDESSLEAVALHRSSPTQKDLLVGGERTMVNGSITQRMGVIHRIVKEQ